MAIHDGVMYRNYQRVKNPSRYALGDVVASADAQMANEAFSPYGALVDDSGAEQMLKIDQVQVEAEISPPLPLGGTVVYDDLLGLSGQLTEQQVYEVYMNAKNGVPPGDIALQYNITQRQVGSIFTAMLNGGTPAEVLNPDQAVFQQMSTVTNDLMSDQPVNFGNPFMTMQTTAMLDNSGAEMRTMSMLPGGASIESALSSIPIWAWGIGALVLFMMMKK